MNNFVNKLYQKNTIIYKVILFLVTTVAIVYLFPKGGQFKYDFSNSQLWKYDNLYAPFDFAIQKSATEIKEEKAQIVANSKLYFTANKALVSSVKGAFNKRIAALIGNDSLSLQEKNAFQEIGLSTIEKVYETGFLEAVIQDKLSDKDMLVAIRKENVVQDIPFKNFYIHVITPAGF